MHDNPGHRIIVASSLSIYSTHASPQNTASTMFHCRHHAFFFVLLTFVMPYSFEAISYENIYLGLITPEYNRVPVVFFFNRGPGKV
ncbi:unnamed protein product [Staurois parvus]|uniref:Uncharacterized protein n=1 Tax=Staurois parvus TaxID=386267 RepID=A0ABN9DJB6_9NEOB|nr:unnamed protein product [Staurois parvus]